MILPDTLIDDIRVIKATADDTGRRSGEAALAAAVLAAEAGTAQARYYGPAGNLRSLLRGLR